jgi:hypothetical protein
VTLATRRAPSSCLSSRSCLVNGERRREEREKKARDRRKTRHAAPSTMMAPTGSRTPPGMDVHRVVDETGVEGSGDSPQWAARTGQEDRLCRRRLFFRLPALAFPPSFTAPPAISLPHLVGQLLAGLAPQLARLDLDCEMGAMGDVCERSAPAFPFAFPHRRRRATAAARARGGGAACASRTPHG